MPDDARKVQEDALAYARQLLDRLGDEPMAFTLVGPSSRAYRFLNKEDNRRFSVEMITDFINWRSSNIEIAIVAAEHGTVEAQQALQEIAFDAVKSGAQLPTALSEYQARHAASAGRPQRKSGPRWGDSFLYNIGITVVVLLVAERFSLARFGRSPRSPSACAVVARALPGSYEKVARIFSEWSKRADILPKYSKS